MNKTQIQTRIQYLRLAIAYSRSEGRIMSVEQGICCNQEIAAWFKVLERISLGMTAEGQAKYTIPQNLEDKAKRINTIIKNTNWEKPEIF